MGNDASDGRRAQKMLTRTTVSGEQVSTGTIIDPVDRSELEVITKLVEHNGILLEYIINKLGLREESSDNE